MKVLVIDCCPRGGASATRRLYQRYLASKGPEVQMETVVLYDEPLEPLRAQDVLRRDALIKAGALDDGMLRYALQFQSADEIVVGAPYWDLSFPSLLKVYLERVSASGVTFRYEGPRPVGCCRAQRILYFSTCGGFIKGAHMGAEYVRRLGEMLGIPETREYRVEGLDIDPARREALLEAGLARVMIEIAADASRESGRP